MFGLDFLGGAKYPDLVRKKLPKGWALGIFLDTFGDASKLIEQVAKGGKCPAIRVHLAWKDQHDFKPSEFGKIAKKAEIIEKLARKYKIVQFYISPACEHRLSSSEAVQLLKMTAAKAPSCVIINNPEKGSGVPGFLTEKHGDGSETPHAIASWDGTSCVDGDVTRWKQLTSKCEIQFLWEPRFNWRRESDDTTPRPKRKGWPDATLIDSVVFLTSNRGNVGSLPSKALFKTHAENNGEADHRAEKPVYIHPTKDDFAELVCLNQKVIHSMMYFGPYEGGGYRYYASEWGFKLAEKARKLSGSPLVKIRVNGKEFGPINPGFRAGYFR